ncbi:hypothetical protein [Sulfuricurvum sp.]|uniref:hypothetical protein n=1 Tax=Sulfuricurvum sp. TaxID=2025608 RepID=UPI00262256BD|nr:hypothetical protein [Sulfuricurvum sp.]MDD3595494.1 hypothetical protein [Sulfuricurvum sp.]
MPLNRLERYFKDYSYIRKGHYPVTDLIVCVYMGDAWTEANKPQQIAISEGLLRSIEAKHFELGSEDVERLFELYDLRGKAERGELPDEVTLQTAFTKIIEEHHLSYQPSS